MLNAFSYMESIATKRSVFFSVYFQYYAELVWVYVCIAVNEYNSKNTLKMVIV